MRGQFKLLNTKRRLLYLKAQFVPFISVIKPDQFMLYGAEIVVCSHINTKHINTVWAERTVVGSFKPVGASRNQ
jgi:hypothetical protein